MTLQKNQEIQVSIESISSDGNGVGRWEDRVIFIPAAAPGDVLRAKIVKTNKKYAYARIVQVITPGPGRREEDCPVSRQCGGCCFRHLTYETELACKQKFVSDALQRIGKMQPEILPILPILPSPQVDRYRNKVQYPVSTGKNGQFIYGFYAARSHHLVPCTDCLLQSKELNETAAQVASLLTEHKITPYDEKNHKGDVRHICLRQSAFNGDISVCLVVTNWDAPCYGAFSTALSARNPRVRSVSLNRNQHKTNVIFGEETVYLSGENHIREMLCGVPLRLDPLSFSQVNTKGAEQLFWVAKEYASLRKNDLLLDLYCGNGVIGLSMADLCRELIGVESLPQAIENAEWSAKEMGLNNYTFYNEDAAAAASRLVQMNYKPNCIILDPPRKGCDDQTLAAVLTMRPERIVMVSCNPATFARDVAHLATGGYVLNKIQPVDMFPRTKHVETVVLLSRKTPDDVIDIDLELDELDITASEAKATYQEIKDYVQDKFGFKVSQLYIAQVKRKHGIIERENYNKPKSDNSKVPQCPPEKETAILDALRHFDMI